jgi:pyruvate kinase
MARMAAAGMDLARMNLSHGDYDFHRKTVSTLRDIASGLDRPVGILLDLQGPKIRTGKLATEEILLKADETIELTTRKVKGDWSVLSVNYPMLPREVREGEKILLDDGNIELRVTEVREDSVSCRIVNGGVIRSYRGINLPESNISIEAVTEKDVQDLYFGLEQEVDFVALSFVRRARDIAQLRDLMAEKKRIVPIIAKIEKPEAITNIDAIIQAADGIMVARGDLGAETSPQDVPIFQKMIIRKCNQAGKPVITATQMLESMINNPRPTRAEAADVANAIFDGTDAVMLSGETAIGKYPERAVRIMADIALRAERELFEEQPQTQHLRVNREPERENVADTVSYSATGMADLVRPRLIVCFTLTGRTASLASKYRPKVPIVAMSPSDLVLRKLSLHWGVYGVRIRQVDTTEALLDQAEQVLVERGLCDEGETVLFMGGVPVLSGGPTNMLKVHRINLSERNI